MLIQFFEHLTIQAGYDWTAQMELDEPVLAPEAVVVAQIRRRTATDVLFTLSTADRTLLIIDEKTMQIALPGAASAAWPAGSVVIDFVRRDGGDIHLGFRAEVSVKVPVTRGLQ